MLLWWGQAVYQDSQLSSTSTEDAGQPANALDVLHSILDMLCQHDTQASLAQENRLRSLEVVCLRCNTQILSGTNTYCMRTSMVVAVTQYFSWASFWCSHVVHFPHSNTRQICACSSIGIFVLDTNFLQRFLWRICPRLQGFVVGFKGSQVFCLHYNSMQALEVPQSASMQGYLAAEDWQNAYKVDILLLAHFPYRSLCSTATLLL